MSHTTYYERLEHQRAVYDKYGLSCPPSEEELIEALCNLSDKLDALAQAEGVMFKRDYRGRWHVFPGRDAS